MSQPSVEAILFDFDHVLAHLGDLVRWEDARVELLPLYLDAGIPEAFISANPGAIGLYGPIGASDFLPQKRLVEVQRQASAIIERFELEAVPRLRLIPAATELVRSLGNLGIQTSIVTSNSARVVTAVLEREELLSAFHQVVGLDETVPRLKPSPSGILAACEALSVTPDRCVYVGDSASDMIAALAAGAMPVGVASGMSSREELAQAGATDVLTDIGALLDLVGIGYERSPDLVF